MRPEAALLTGQAWALLPETLSHLGEPSLVWASRPTAVQRSPGRFGGNVGYVSIIPIRGIITHRESLRSQIFGGTSIERLTQEFRYALSDRSTVAIVFDVDSPGGEVAGTEELAGEIFRSRSKKKIVAVANGTAVAGAYWLASAAEDLVATQSGMVGSIGVMAEHEDLSGALNKAGVRVTLISSGKFKTAGNNYEPLPDSARAYMQKMLDDIHGKFCRDVARGRGETSATVRQSFGQGRSVLAETAFAIGMVDRVATLDQTLARFASGRENPKPSESAFAEISRLREELDSRFGGHA